MTKLILLKQQQLSQQLVTQLHQQFSGISNHRLSENAAEILLPSRITSSDKKMIQEHCIDFEIDTVFLNESFDAQKIRLLAFDMDSTLINIECIDEIARAVGKMEEVSKITEASMRGEIKNFSEGLIARVKLLRGVPEKALHEVFTQRLQLNPGAENLIRGAKLRGWNTLLVSGGFTFFTNRIKEQLGLDEAYSNTLEIENGYLTGNVIGPIVDGLAKAHFVEQSCRRIGVSTQSAITMGDGSNDLPMMELSGLSIGYQPKPIVQEKADGTFQFVGLDAVLEIFPVKA
jgi:phosphoserine phosphatase